MYQADVTLYTDGSFVTRKYPQLGAGGYAGLMVCGNSWQMVYGNEPFASNNSMELFSVLACLRCLTVPCRVQVVSDSQYVVTGIQNNLANWALNGWITTKRQPIANQALWEELYNFMSVHAITAQWVRGHALHSENNLVDKFANRSARALLNSNQ